MIWSEVGREESLALAALVMQSCGVVPATKLKARLGSLRVEAASRVRAAGAALRGLRVGTGEVEAEVPRPSHSGFFGLDVHRLRHRRFDGGMSPWITREVFVVGDAVTVLPYDPVRDRVLLIEQMRIGAVGPRRPAALAVGGDCRPDRSGRDPGRCGAARGGGGGGPGAWSAGDGWPSTTPTPGAVAEYLYSFVALCDLPDGVAGVFGAASGGRGYPGAASVLRRADRGAGGG